MYCWAYPIELFSLVFSSLLAMDQKIAKLETNPKTKLLQPVFPPLTVILNLKVLVPQHLCKPTRSSKIRSLMVTEG